jgi:ankyrin repeat protein
MVRNDEEDGPVLQRSTPIPRPQPYSIRPTPAEAQEMENILLAIRSRAVANVKGLKKTFSSSAKREQAPYTVKELYEALQQAVTINADAGVIFILCHRLVSDHRYDLNYSRRATTSLVKRMKNSDSQDQRGNLLQIVAQSQRPDLVHILGFYADQISLDETLPIALSNHNKDVTSLLLGFGADASGCQAAFNEFGRKGDADMIKLLLGASRRPANIAQCLLSAVYSASIPSVLLLSGQMPAAGFSEQVDSALQHAVEINRDDIVHALVIGTHPPSGTCLNRAIETVFAEVSVDLNEKLKMVKLLLWGGPEGNQVDEALVKATTRGCIPMMKLLLDGRASIDHRRGAAVSHSVRRSRDDLLDILLKDENLATDIASEAIGEIDHNASSDLKCAIASKLLTQGASGRQTNELLVHAVQSRDLALARILVRNGADVNYDEAKGLKIATSDRLVDILKIMLAARPSNHSLLLAFKAIPMADREYRYLASKALLQAGATGSDIDNAFINALEQPEDNKELIELFVDYVSDIAITRSILPVVKILDRAVRFRTVNMILLRAVQKKIGLVEISQSVVETLQRYPDDIHLLDLLCQEGRADLNYNNGQALVLSIQQETKVFDRLSAKGVIPFSPYSIACGLRAAIQHHGGKSRHHIVRALLRRIPRYNSSDQRLLDVISQAVIDVLRDSTNDIVLLHLLCIEGRADCNFLKGKAVAMAITCENQEVFDTIVTSCSTLLPETVGMGLGLAMATISQARPTRIATLLSKNPPQDAKDSALVTEIEECLRARQDYKVVELLLAAGANINALGSKSMCLSVKDEVLMDILLGHSPSQQSLSRAFRLAVALPTRAERINLCSKLLRAGKVGKDINIVFCKCAESTPIDIPFMELLFPQADINFKNGLGLCNAIRGKQYQAVGLILTKTPQSDTLQSAVQEAMQLKPYDERIRFMEMLLKAEARGEYLSDALITAVNDGDKILIERLLTCGASLEHQGGRGIENAARFGSIEILRSIISGDFCSKPNLATLTKGFVAAAAMRDNEELYYTMAEIFLKAGTKGEVVDQALVEAVRKGDSHLRVTELLLKSGASVEYQEGQAISIAAGNPHLQTLNILLKQGPSEKVLSQAFNSGIQLAADIRFPTIESIMKANKACDTQVSGAFSQAAEENPTDQRLLNLLLSYDVFDEGEAMKHAASAFDHEIMSILVKAPQARHYLSGTIKFLMSRKDIWRSDQAVFVAKDLLGAGASGRVVNEALLLAVEKCETDNLSTADKFVDLLLQFQADVDYRRGLVLQTAFQNGNLVLARKLLPHASDQTKMMASQYILAGDPAFDEEGVIELIKCISGSSHLFRDWSDFGHPDTALDPMIFMALRKYPNNCRILKALLEVGISPNEGIASVLDSRIGDETTPVLCWAVMQPAKTISGDMISLLIDHGGEKPIWCLSETY